VSLSRTHNANGDKTRVARTVIRSFEARDAGDGTIASFLPGDAIERYEIQRNRTADADDGVYVMTFASRGRQFRCPLVRFQARTAATASELVEETPARETATVS
jgi:hypothetical protein